MVEIAGKSSELIHGKHISASAHGMIILLINTLLGFFSVYFDSWIALFQIQQLEKKEPFRRLSGLYHTTFMLLIYLDSVCEMVHLNQCTLFVNWSAKEEKLLSIQEDPRSHWIPISKRQLVTKTPHVTSVVTSKFFPELLLPSTRNLVCSKPALFVRTCWQCIWTACLHRCFLLFHVSVTILVSFLVPGSPHTKYEKEFNYYNFLI